MESEQLYHRGYCRNSYNSIASASSDEELLDGAGVIMDFHTTEDDNLLDGDATSPVALPLTPSSSPSTPISCSTCRPVTLYRHLLPSIHPASLSCSCFV
ncbi:hypothetical protein EPR50_G00196160 [Perca flavescens]|uniref:Uncharacterized protein n=1 Tax=Perca flavescens TaxID=8167 RepID=A0A484C779_PERFV|nr:hypothetical protein EPR50_G00196160 [Perca flavescens]